MHTSMTFLSVGSLLLAMLVLSALPSVSVLLVTAQSATNGFRNGVSTTLGIVLGDIVYLLVALFGLTYVSTAFDAAPFLLKIAAGTYMLVMGIGLWRSSSQRNNVEAVARKTLLGSFAAGFFLTLSDQKVVLFYLGFLPAFINIADVNSYDAVILVATTVFAVGAVKMTIAYFATEVGTKLGPRFALLLNRIASVVLVMIGISVMFR